MNHPETVAKRVLEAVLPCTMEYQPEQSHGEYDFELRYQVMSQVLGDVVLAVLPRMRRPMAS